MTLAAKDIPDNWEVADLKSLSAKLTDGSHNPPKKQDSGLPMLSAKNIENNFINWDASYRYITPDDFELEDRRTAVEPGDVLLTIVGTIGRSCVVPSKFKKFTLQRSVAVIKPRLLDSRFVCYQLQSPRVNNYLNSNSKGTAQKGIYLKGLGALPLLVAPLEQQKRIVAKIEELFSHIDAGIKALNKAKQLLKQYRQSVLKAAVTGELTKEWREQNKDTLVASDKLLQQLELSKKEHNEHVIDRWEDAKKKWKKEGEVGKRPGKPKITNELLALDEDLLADLPSLPDSWAWVLLGDIGDAVDPQPSHRTPPELEGGIPYIGIGDVNKVKGEINFENARKVSPDVLKEHVIRYDLKDGDFIIGKIGTIGKPFQIPIERFYTLSANVVLVCPNTSLIDPSYVFNLCKSPLIEYQFDSGSKATTQAAFGIKKVRTLAVPFCSVKEQNIIVEKMEECLEKADRLGAEIDFQSKKAEKNKQSILASAFSGGLS